MWPTTEVRWFYRLFEVSGIPTAIWQWFTDLPGAFEAQPQRTDYYLLLQESPDLGVKVREGKLEVKYRLARPTSQVLGPEAVGQVEQWGKWAAATGSTDSVPEPGYPWQGVSKKRWLRRYLPLQQESIAPSPLPEGQLGCFLELAQIRLGGSAWWSLALEAYGRSGEARQEHLQWVAGIVLRTGRPPELEIAASLSYPKWLEMN